MDKKIMVPDSWAEVSIRQFQEIEQSHNEVEKIAALANADPVDIGKMNKMSYDKVSKAIQWIETMPTGDPKNVITIEGKEYKLIMLSSLSLGQWMDIETYIKDSVSNLHKLMAVFYKGEGTNAERADLFLDKISIQDAYCMLVFFSLIGKNCLTTIRGYLEREILLMEMKRKLKEKSEKQRSVKPISGPGSYLPTTYLKVISQTWKKYWA